MSEYPSGYNSHTSAAPPFNVTTHVTREIPPAGHSQDNLARLTYQKLAECIFHFENSLEDDHEVGARLTPFASDTTFYLQEIGYYDPHMISFTGDTENGQTLQLVQHVSQLSVCFVAMETRGDEPVRIGFKLKRAAEKAS